MDQFGNGSIEFVLRNTGSSPATIEQVSVDIERGPYAAIYESNPGECNQCHEMVFNATDDGYYESGDMGTAYPLGTVASLQNTSTVDPGTNVTVYMSTFRNNGGQPVNASRTRFNVTITYADGSTAQYTVTPEREDRNQRTAQAGE